MVGLLQAPVGTRLYERMQQEGRLVNEFSGDNVDGTTNIIPKMAWNHCGKAIASSWSKSTPRSLL